MNTKLKEVATLFLQLGFTAFGGPAAHIAMMKLEVVNKRQWLTEQEFLDLLGATNLIPGPNSTEMAIHLGYERAGWRGLVVGGLCFILPAVFITLGFAWAYGEYGQLPEVQPFIYCIKPAIVAIILAAVYPLAKKSLKTTALGVIGAAALVLSFLGVAEIYVLFGAGFIGLGMTYWKMHSNLPSANSFLPFILLQMPTLGLFSSENAKIFLIFLKVGSILYGSGYVLFAFLDAELVATGLLSKEVLVDAIAVGQFTPGPVFSSVAFIGYQMNSWSGAALATLGIFLPSFVFVALLSTMVKKMRGSVLFAGFLDAVNIASVAVIAAVCVEIGKVSIDSWQTVFILIVSLGVSFFFKHINSAFVVLGGSLLGYLLQLV